MSTSSAVTSPESYSGTQEQSTSRRYRVSAEHTLNRVRENQRRHRARRREHVTTLEQQLAETRQLLSDAREEIRLLKAKAVSTNTNCRCSTSESLPKLINSEQDSPTRAGLQVVGLKNSSYSSFTQPETAFSAVDSAARIWDGLLVNDVLLPAIPATCESQSTTLGAKDQPPPCCYDPSTVPSAEEKLGPECPKCKTRPPPGPLESTTLCSQAYILISQQNFYNMDQDTIRSLLNQGLRRAQREGEGCRVENGTLLRLLDVISGG